MKKIFFVTFILVCTLYKSQHVGLNILELQKQNRELKFALENCIINSQKASANIQKLIDEIESSNKYIKKLIKQNITNDSINLRLVNLYKANIKNENIENEKIKENNLLLTYNSEFTHYQAIEYGLTSKQINKQNFEFIKDDSILMLDLKLNIFVIANETNKIFYIYDSTEPTLYSSGDIITEYFVRDENKNEYIVRFIKIKAVHPNRKYNLQIYIEYDDALEIYNVIE